MNIQMVVAIATAIVVSLVGALGIVWRWAEASIKREKDDCATRIERLETRVRQLEVMWQREVERGLRLLNTAPPPIPARPPMPSWEETTDIRDAREMIETAERNRVLREYLESNPPPPNAASVAAAKPRVMKGKR